MEYKVEVEIDPVSGRVVSERWANDQYQLDRAGDLPAVIEYSPETGKPTFNRWHKAGQQHRDDGKPALLQFCETTGTILVEEYAVCGKVHREGDEPAHITRAPDGTVTERVFAKHGVFHRLNGPAVEKFDLKDGSQNEVQFWVEGHRMPSANHDPDRTPEIP